MSEFNYKDKSAPKLTEEFKKKFVVNIKNTETIKVDGLIAFAHEKGLKSMKTKILQYPNQENQWTCIAECLVIGYDWNPITEKIEEVEFQDFADANPTNCTAMTKASYIRMASTRCVGRTLRKYTNIDMVTSEEINQSVDNSTPPEPLIEMNELVTIKQLIGIKHLTPEDFSRIMFEEFQHTNYQGLNQTEGKRLISILNALTAKPAPVPAGTEMVQPQTQQTQ